jgi:hypothetical protein
MNEALCRSDYNPMPESTLSTNKGLRLWPLDAFIEYKLCKKEERKCIFLHVMANILDIGSRPVLYEMQSTETERFSFL